LHPYPYVRASAEIKLGRVIPIAFPRGGSNGNQYAVATLDRQRLADIGIGYKQSSRFQAWAAGAREPLSRYRTAGAQR